MKQFYTVVLDRMTTFSGKLDSEPYEAGWADEAIAFVRVHDLKEGSKVSFHVQISPDGINWIDEGTPAKEVTAVGVDFLRVREFGGWLRLCIESHDECKVTTYLSLKG
jgi:kynurenine formamidase